MDRRTIKLLTIFCIAAVAVTAVYVASETEESDAAEYSWTWWGIYMGMGERELVVGDTFEIMDGEGSPQSITVISYPSGAYLNNSTKQLVWIPTATGTYNITFKLGAPAYDQINETVTVTFTVKASATLYTLKYDSQGGSPTPPTQQTQSFNDNYSFTIPAQYRVGGTNAPTKAGYVFKGWSYWTTGPAELGNGQTNVNTATSYGTRTIYAIWEPININTISFTANGGSSTPGINNMQVASGTQISLPVTGFSKTGSYLSGWRLGSTSGTHYDLASLYTVAGAATFYAEWTALPSNNISAAPTTGTVGILYSFKVDMDTFPFGMYWLALPPSSMGYIVAENKPSWLDVTRSGNDVIFSGTPTAAGLYTVKMYVQGANPGGSSIFWTIAVADPTSTEKFSVRFTPNEGTGNSFEYTSQNNNAIVLPSDGFIRPGYTLAGWQTTVNSAQAVFLLGQIYTVKSNVEMKAYWVADANLVIFNLAGGDGTIDPYIAQTGDVITLPSSGLNKLGYTFRGWIDMSRPNAVYAPGYLLSVSGPTKLTAYWVQTGASTATATFNANGGTGSLSQIVETGKSVYTPAYGFNRANYMLTGWNQGSTSGNLHSKGATVSISSTTTFYAAWTASSQTVTVVFDANGGSGSFPPQNITSGGKATQPTNPPTKNASVFIGWKVVGGPEWDFNNAVTSSMTLQAQWQSHFTTSIKDLTVTLTMLSPYLSGYTTTVYWGDGTETTANNIIYTHTYTPLTAGQIIVESKAGTTTVSSMMPFSVSSGNDDDDDGDGGGGGGGNNGGGGGNNDELITALKTIAIMLIIIVVMLLVMFGGYFVFGWYSFIFGIPLTTIILYVVWRMIG